jgi:excinuclease ABC subunit C
VDGQAPSTLDCGSGSAVAVPATWCGWAQRARIAARQAPSSGRSRVAANAAAGRSSYVIRAIRSRYCEPVSVRMVVAALPSGPGVYRFRSDTRVLYIGRAVDLRRRVTSYWGDLRDRPHLRRMVATIERVEAAECDSDHEAAWLERNLLEQAKPRWNRTAGGQEVPVQIRLDPRAGRIDVVHDHDAAGGQLFGPYLGGLKVRLAVGGLRRVIPLAYAGERLSGFDRDMARVRGVVGSRASMVDAAVALLSGDPAAAAHVRSELATRRDAAATALAFELAGRIQTELAALDWVLSEQKVTRSTGDDEELHGWCDGLLVTFTVRAGRLRTWRQRPCGEAQAADRVAGTPAAWRPFVDRNAALAARLLART